MAKKQPKNIEKDHSLIKDTLTKCIISNMDASAVTAVIAALVSKQNTFNKTDVKQLYNSLKKEAKKSIQPIIPEMFLLPAGVQLTNRYVIRITGVFETKENSDGEKFEVPITNAPICIDAKCFNISDGTYGCRLTVFYDNKSISILVKRDVISTISKITELSLKGFPIHSVNAGAVILYLDAQLHASLETIPEIKTTSTPGWQHYEGITFFVYGKKAILPSGCSYTIERDDSTSDRSFIDSYKISGSFDVWLVAFIWAKQFPIVLFQFAAALAAPLLELLGVANFTIHVWSESTRGKSAGLQLCVSFFGCPTKSGLIKTWRTTTNAAEARLAECNGLLTVFDDSSEVPNQYTIAEVIYMIGNGSSKSRATKSGDGKKAKTFSTIALSNGERPLSLSNSLGGQEVRTLVIQADPFIEHNADIGKKIREMTEVVTRNYGHLAPQYLQTLVDIANDSQKLDDFREEFKNLRKTRAANVTEPFLLRTVDYFAVIELALKLAQKRFPQLAITDAEIQSAISDAFSRQEERLQDSSATDMRALKYVWERILSELTRFNTQDGFSATWGRKVSKKDNFGSAHEYGFAILPSKLSEILQQGGFNFEASTTFFKQREVVELDEKQQLKAVNMDGHTVRCFVFLKQKALELGILVKPEAKPVDASPLIPNAEGLI